MLSRSLTYDPSPFCATVKLGPPRRTSAAHLTDAITQVNEAVLRKVIEWCEHHKGDSPATNDDESDSRKRSTDIEEWDQKFMQVDQEMLFEIILVSSELRHQRAKQC